MWAPLSMRKRGGAQQAIHQCVETLGAPTMLAHCVGNILLAPAARTTESQHREVMRATLDSAFFTLGAFVAAARTAGISASACFVSTIAAGIGIANHDAVAAAKGDLEAMVRSAAATYAAQRHALQRGRDGPDGHACWRKVFVLSCAT